MHSLWKEARGLSSLGRGRRGYRNDQGASRQDPGYRSATQRGLVCQLLDLVPYREFVEHGALRGAALRSPEASFSIALRDRQFCASQPDLTGFDAVALQMASREALSDLAARCDRLGIAHSQVQDRGPHEAVVDVPDPDGTVLRFFWERQSEETLRFMGLSSGAEGQLTFYDTPRLRMN